ncbi:MAG: hypothetical protein ACMG6S_33910 [Byssovorax sp.]
MDQAIDGEFRAATASTVKAVGVGVATGIALGELVLPLELKDGAPLILATTSAPSRR